MTTSPPVPDVRKKLKEYFEFRQRVLTAAGKVRTASATTMLPQTPLIVPPSATPSKVRTLIKSIELFYTSKPEGSDKQYNLKMYSNGDGTYDVETAFGKRGTVRQGTSKGIAGASRVEADRTFANLVVEKRNKGYTTDISGRPFGPIAWP